MRLIKRILVLILLFFSIEYVGNGVLSVYRVIIFPLSLLGCVKTFRYKKESTYATVIFAFIVYFLLFSLCFWLVDDEDVLFPLFISPLLIFLFSVWFLKVPIEIDYSKIFMWYYVPHFFALVTGTANWGNGRFSGLHEDPNFCGIFLVFSIISSVELLVRKSEPKTIKGLSLASLVASIIMLALTNSRGAILSLLAIGAIIFFKSKVKFIWKALTIISIIVATGSLWQYILNLPDWVSPEDSVVDAFLCRFKPDAMASGSGRSELWEVALRRIEEKGAYLVPLGRENAMRGMINKFSHNTFLDFLIEQGVVMGSISIFLILVAMWRSFIKKKTDYEVSFFYCSISLMMQLFFLSAMSQKIFWICVFFIVYLSKTKRKLPGIAGRV